MFKRCATHARRLLVVAFATTLECLAASNIHAQSERTQNFQDRYIEAQAPQAAIQRTFPSLQSCGTSTSAPAIRAAAR